MALFATKSSFILNWIGKPNFSTYLLKLKSFRLLHLFLHLTANIELEIWAQNCGFNILALISLKETETFRIIVVPYVYFEVILLLRVFLDNSSPLKSCNNLSAPVAEILQAISEFWSKLTPIEFAVKNFLR